MQKRQLVMNQRFKFSSVKGERAFIKMKSIICRILPRILRVF